jgi:aldehyde dehydrogenase (NAD+)
MTAIPPLGGYTPERRVLIVGELVHSSTGAEFDNVNPATEKVLGQVADGSAEDDDNAQ